MTVKVELKGFKELEKALLKLPQATAKGAARRVLKKAAEPTRAKAATLAPDDPRTDSEDLNRAIAISTRLNKTQGRKHRAKPNEVRVYVGPAGNRMKRYAAAIVNEFGSYKMAAQPYMRPAWASTQKEALDIIRKEMAKEVQKTVARFEKRQAKK